MSAARSDEPSTKVVIWDTQSRFAETVDVQNRTAWKAVPTDLLTLEADPAKAFSDPGYYGREYVFAGDAVVENGHLDRRVLVEQGTAGDLLEDRSEPEDRGVAPASQDGVHGRHSMRNSAKYRD